jgi:hypothetical protein
MEKIECPRCRTEIDAEDYYCRRCGIHLKPAEPGEFAQVQIVTEPRPVRPRASDNPWIVLTMLFLVLGPLGLPMLWHGRAFTLRGKWILTAVTVLYVAFVCWFAWFLTVKMILEPLSKLRF